MRRALIALIECGIMVSAFAVTSVASAKPLKPFDIDDKPKITIKELAISGNTKGIVDT